MKDRIEVLKKMKAELVDTQKYCIDKNIGKKQYITYKISYLDAMLEYLLTGYNDNNFGRIDGEIAYYNEHGEKMFVNKLVEDINNKDMKRFVNKVCKIAFYSYYQRIVFQESPSRRGLRENFDNLYNSKVMIDDVMHFSEFSNKVSKHEKDTSPL